MKEILKDIEGYEGLYQVSNLGYIRALDKIVIDTTGKKQQKYGCILKGWIDASGYLMVGLYKNNSRKVVKVHRIVAKYFIPNPENKREVNHIDRDKLNNCVTNLEWVTPKENMKHLENNFGFDFGRKKIVMMDTEGEILAYFDSITEAGRYLKLPVNKKTGKINSTLITRVVKAGKGTAYGYKWSYLN